MDFDRATWLMAGLVIGNLLDTFTTVILLIIWLVARNQPLPECLGGYYPQDLLADFFFLVNFWASRILPFRKFQKSDITIEEITSDENSLNFSQNQLIDEPENSEKKNENFEKDESLSYDKWLPTKDENIIPSQIGPIVNSSIQSGENFPLRIHSRENLENFPLRIHSRENLENFPLRIHSRENLENFPNRRLSLPNSLPLQKNIPKQTNLVIRSGRKTQSIFRPREQRRLWEKGRPGSSLSISFPHSRNIQQS